jgi:thiamine kinase-like enzyme
LKESEETIFFRKKSFLQQEFNTVDKEQIRFGAVHLDVWFDNMHFNEDNKVTLLILISVMAGCV